MLPKSRMKEKAKYDRTVLSEAQVIQQLICYINNKKTGIEDEGMQEVMHVENAHDSAQA